MTYFNHNPGCELAHVELESGLASCTCVYNIEQRLDEWTNRVWGRPLETLFDVITLKFKKCHPDAVTPTRANPDDAGLDLYCLQDTYIPKHSTTRVPTGIAVAIPPGWEGQVRPRSSMGLKGVVAILGTIDAGYHGPLSLPTIAHHESYTVHKGERLGQLVLHKLPIVILTEVNELPPSQRGDKGFGSSGK